MRIGQFGLLSICSSSFVEPPLVENSTSKYTYFPGGLQWQVWSWRAERRTRALERIADVLEHFDATREP